jgi:hypothetical protein
MAKFRDLVVDGATYAVVKRDGVNLLLALRRPSGRLVDGHRRRARVTADGTVWLQYATLFYAPADAPRQQEESISFWTRPDEPIGPAPCVVCAREEGFFILRQWDVTPVPSRGIAGRLSAVSYRAILVSGSDIDPCTPIPPANHPGHFLPVWWVARNRPIDLAEVRP